MSNRVGSENINYLVGVISVTFKYLCNLQTAHH